eukprot:366199-Chlamydomonas_euryale.AAC.6
MATEKVRGGWMAFQYALGTGAAVDVSLMLPVLYLTPAAAKHKLSDSVDVSARYDLGRRGPVLVPGPVP